MQYKKTAVLLAILFIFRFVNAAITLPALIGDNMVLQQNTNACIWGKAAAGKSVSVVASWTGRKFYCTASANGDWKIYIPTPAAGGPFTIKISDGTQKILHNVLVGEVWLCSGQSNMEMPVKGFMGLPVAGSLDEILTANEQTGLHFITIARKASKTPLGACTGTWVTSNSSTISNLSATAYFFAKYLKDKLKVPIGLIVSSWGGANIQAWTDKETLSAFPEVSFADLVQDVSQMKRPHQEPTLLYNGMISPLLNYSFRGVIWYQGEANRANAPLYKKIFPAMVKSWRSKFNNRDMPFYYVQIAPYCANNCDSLENAQLRQAQLECLHIIPHSGMAVTADIGEPNSVHPADKNDVGKRLALWALTESYHVTDLPYSGPIIRSAKIDSATGDIILSFDHVHYGLYSTDAELRGFEVVDNKGQVIPVKATIKNNIILIRDKEIKNPAFVQLDYKNYFKMDLFNTEGLPASPFRIPIDSNRQTE